MSGEASIEALLQQVAVLPEETSLPLGSHPRRQKRLAGTSRQTIRKRRARRAANLHSDSLFISSFPNFDI